MALIAGTVDIAVLLRTLALQRPVYHSEADFQHAFAWEAHRTDPSLPVRLETHPEPNVRLDLLLRRPDLGLRGCSGRWSLRCHPRRELGGGRQRCDAPSLSAPRDPRRNYRTGTSACGDETREAG